MTETFPPDAKKLLVPVTVVGPLQGFKFNLTLDTGSGITVVSAMYLRRLGVDLSRPVSWTHLRTATGIARAPLVRVPAVSALGRVRTDFVVAAHDYPLGVQADGVLGLDFFRGLVLRIDFARGRIALDTPKRLWQFWRAA
jgi:predicted aspartyl protease